jgi:prepilin-type N-terminal cleavage/methylation domain-containing protein
MNPKLKPRKMGRDKGLTLIELLVAMVISAILIAAIYRTFIGQQKTYVVQEQVTDMQQNIRVAVSKMMREIRMAGFGKVSHVLNLPGGVNGFTQVITPGNNTLGHTITIVGGFKQIRRDNGDPILITSASGNKITLNYSTDEFDKPAHKFICIGGIESNTVQSRSETILTLDEPLIYNHPEGTAIYKIQAITYDLDLSDGTRVLRRNENTGGGSQPVAENIEDLQFEYFGEDKNGDGIPDPPTTPDDIRMVKVTVIAKTSISDPEFKGGTDGFRRRTIALNVDVRNMGLNP